MSLTYPSISVEAGGGIQGRSLPSGSSIASLSSPLDVSGGVPAAARMGDKAPSPRRVRSVSWAGGKPLSLSGLPDLQDLTAGHRLPTHSF